LKVFGLARFAEVLMPLDFLVRCPAVWSRKRN